MARAAVYVRVSTDEQSASAEEQERGARAWCARQGHVVVHIYKDVGVSGAEWKKRPGVLELDADARRSPAPFDLVVVRDLDRLGRDAARVPVLLAALARRKIEVVTWSTGETVRLDGAHKLVLQITAAVAEHERELIAGRATVSARARAARGEATGGRVYGYQLVRVDGAWRWVAHPEEAAVVRDCYARVLQGESHATILRALHDRAIPAPWGGAWSLSTLQRVLHNPRYRGEVTWGRRTHAYLDDEHLARTRQVVRRPDAECVTTAGEALVDAATWEAVQTALRTRTLHFGRNRSGPARKYLLSGLTRCGICGGNLNVAARPNGERQYFCARARLYGATVCPNNLRQRVADVDGAFVAFLRDAVFAPAVVDAIVARAMRRAEALQAETADPAAPFVVARDDARRRAQGAARALAYAPDSEALLAELRTAEADAARAEARIRELTPPDPAAALDPAALRARLLALESLLGGDVPAAQTALRTLLPEGLQAFPEGEFRRRYYRLEGVLTLGGNRAFSTGEGSYSAQSGCGVGDWTLHVSISVKPKETP